MNKTVDELIKDYKRNYLQNINYQFAQLGILKDAFINKFSESFISQMKLDDYVIGKGNRESFCYWLEYQLKDLGEIRGPNSDKYGIHYNSEKQIYECTKKFSKTQDIEEAFGNIKTEILLLLDAAKNTNYKYISEYCKLSDTIKGKIAFLYNPGQYINIFSKSHLTYFLKALGLNVSNSTIEMQNELLRWKNSNNVCREWSNFAFSWFLYKELGYPPSEIKNVVKNYEIIEKSADTQLNKEISEDNLSNIQKCEEDGPEAKQDAVIQNGVRINPRNKKKSEQALVNANFLCEIDNTHISFQRRKDNYMYMEAHHLIPMSQTDNYDKSLDVISNIVCLCSNCHNKIHYGRNEDVKEMLIKLFNDRKDRFDKSGIIIEETQLLSMYNIK